MRSRLIVVVAALVGLSAAASDIVRCKDARGGVTYQPPPCPDRTEESRPQIPSSYAQPNMAERQRLLEQESALTKRLDARRERDGQEQKARDARAQSEADRQRAAAAVAERERQNAASPYWRLFGPYGGPTPTNPEPRVYP